MAQLALAWLLRHDNVSAAMIGGSRPEQVADNVKAPGYASTTPWSHRSRRSSSQWSSGTRPRPLTG